MNCTKVLIEKSIHEIIRHFYSNFNLKYEEGFIDNMMLSSNFYLTENIAVRYGWATFF